MQVVEKGAMDVLFTADASPWAPDAGTCAHAHQMLAEAHRCAADQQIMGLGLALGLDFYTSLTCMESPLSRQLQ